MIDQMALEQISLGVPSFFPLLTVTPPLLHIFLSPLPAVYDSVGKATRYLTLNL